MAHTRSVSRVDKLLEEAGSEARKEAIRKEYGYVSTKQAKRHGERVTLRMEQVSQVGKVKPGLIELCSQIKHYRSEVPEVSVSQEEEASQPTELPKSLAWGVSGPGAELLKPSAVKVTKRPAPDKTQEEVDTKNNCFLCSHILMRGAEQSCLRDLSQPKRPYVNRHSADGKGTKWKCAAFDEKYPTGNPDRETHLARAKKLRTQELGKFRMRNKRIRDNAAVSFARLRMVA